MSAEKNQDASEKEKETLKMMAIKSGLGRDETLLHLNTISLVSFLFSNRKWEVSTSESVPKERGASVIVRMCPAA